MTEREPTDCSDVWWFELARQLTAKRKYARCDVSLIGLPLVIEVKPGVRVIEKVRPRGERK